MRRSKVAFVTFTLALLLSAISPTSKSADISGTYVSAITTNTNWFFRYKKHRKLLATLKQDGNSITGSDGFTNASINGTRTGDTITFEYWSSPVNKGFTITGRWEVSVDGTKLQGSWNDQSGQAGGKWNLTKTE